MNQVNIPQAEEIVDAIEKIMALSPLQFTLMGEQSTSGWRYGFLLSEVQAALPNVALDRPGMIHPATALVRPSILVPLLVAAVQDFITNNPNNSEAIEAITTALNTLADTVSGLGQADKNGFALGLILRYYLTNRQRGKRHVAI